MSNATEELETKAQLNSNLTLELESLREERIRMQKELESGHLGSELQCDQSHDSELDQDTVVVESLVTQRDTEDTFSVSLTTKFQLITTYFGCARNL